MKIYECKICKKLSDNKIKGEEGFIGIRFAVRKHLVEVHHLKGKIRRPIAGKQKFYPSEITPEVISREIR